MTRLLDVNNGLDSASYSWLFLLTLFLQNVQATLLMRQPIIHSTEMPTSSSPEEIAFFATSSKTFISL